MVLNFTFMLLFISFQAFANTESFLSFVASPSTSVPLCSEEDPYQKCAEELCGPPDQHQSMTLKEYNFERFLSQEGKATLPKVSADLEKLLINKIAQSKKIIDELNQKKAAGNLLPNFSSLSTEDWDQLAVSVYQNHLGLNPSRGLDEKTLNRIKVGSSVSKGLKEFADNFSCSTPVCRKGVKDYLSEELFDRKLSELTLKVSNSKLLADRLPKCISSYALTAVKTNQHEKIKKALPVFFDQFIQQALDGYSDHSKQVFRKFLDEKLIIKYEEPERSSADYLKELKTLSEPDSLERSDVDAMMFFRSGETMDPLSAVSSVCPDSFANVGGDAFSTQGNEENTKSALVISLGSQMDPASGEAILYHELGHALSHVMGQAEMSKSSKEAFLKLRECVKSLSPQDSAKFIRPAVYHPKDHKCTEEDAADITSFKVTASQSGPLLECSLLGQSSDKTEYEKLDMLEKNGHSAKLVRILREAVHRNRSIPPTCQKVIEQNQDRLLFKKCF